MTAKVMALCLLPALLIGCGTTDRVSPAERAGSLRRQGQLAEAFGALAEAVCADPSSRDLDTARAFVEVWRDLGQPGTPAARIAACEIQPGVRSFIDGLAAATAGDLDTADRLLAAAQTQLPAAAHGELLYRRGLVALGAHRAAVAREYLEGATGLAPERAEIRLALSRAHLELGQFETVIGILRNLVKIAPSREDIERGHQLLRAAVRAAEVPLEDEIETRLEATLSALDRAELSREDLLAILVLANEVRHPRVLTVAGIAALRFGAEPEGARLLREATELNPLDPDPPRALGIALLAGDRANEALGPLRVAFGRDPLDSDLARYLGEAASAIGDREAAREAYRALVVLEPRVTDNHLWLARTERQLGDFVAAGHAVEVGYRLDAQSIPVLLERAVIHARLANTAPTQAERLAAARLTRESVAELLALAPGHPGAGAILDSLAP